MRGFVTCIVRDVDVSYGRADEELPGCTVCCMVKNDSGKGFHFEFLSVAYSWTKRIGFEDLAEIQHRFIEFSYGLFEGLLIAASIELQEFSPYFESILEEYNYYFFSGGLSHE